MKNILMLVFLFNFCANFAQNKVNPNSTLNSLKVNINVSKNKNLRGIPVDTLDSLMIKKTPKPKIQVVKDYLQPKSNSCFDMAIYVVKKQLQDSPIISWILTVMLGFWIVIMIKRWIEKITNR